MYFGYTKTIWTFVTVRNFNAGHRKIGMQYPIHIMQIIFRVLSERDPVM